MVDLANLKGQLDWRELLEVKGGYNDSEDVCTVEGSGIVCTQEGSGVCMVENSGIVTENPGGGDD